MVNYTYSTPAEAGYNLTTGVDRYFAWIINQDSSFINYFLLMVWAIIFMGGSFVERKITNSEDYIKWGFLASFITFGLTLILGLTSDLNVWLPGIVSFAVLIGFILAQFNWKFLQN